MKKPVFLLFMAAVISLSLAQEAFAFSASFQQKITQGTLVIQLKIQMKEKKMRVESTFTDKTTVMIRNESGTYQVAPNEKTVLKIPAELDRPSLADELPDFTQFLKKQSAKLTGSETVDGHACDIYEFKDPATLADSKAWVWKEKKFPVKIEIGSPVSGITRIEMTDIRLDQPIDDKAFELPAGLPVTDLAAMNSELPEIAKSKLKPAAAAQKK